jgi:hypothetical protein
MSTSSIDDWIPPDDRMGQYTEYLRRNSQDTTETDDSDGQRHVAEESTYGRVDPTTVFRNNNMGVSRGYPIPSSYPGPKINFVTARDAPAGGNRRRTTPAEEVPEISRSREEVFSRFTNEEMDEIYHIILQHEKKASLKRLLANRKTPEDQIKKPTNSYASRSCEDETGSSEDHGILLHP